MKEDLVQFIWKYLLFDFNDLKTIEGEILQIIKQGNINTNSGPDFDNAIVKVGDTKWAGAVEIHINASDWNKHKHSQNKAFDKVILHVVFNSDCAIYNSKGSKIPCLELKGRIPLKMLKRYEQLNLNESKISCRNLLESVTKFDWDMWKERLLIERFFYKATDINKRLAINNNDWEDCFYQLLCKSLGLKVNATPFERLALLLPKSILNKHLDDLVAVESMLFGVAGFLGDNKIKDDYYKVLQKEYHHYKNKFDLEEVNEEAWKFMRMRPAAFPTIRLAQLAALLHKNNNLFGQICNLKTVKEVRNLFKIKASQYWDAHYVFGELSKIKRAKKLGDSTINLILINAICPLLFVFGKAYNKPNLCNKAIAWMAEIKPENNSIIKEWKTLDVSSKNAGESQALIHLYNEFCSPKKCLDCQIGAKVLRN